MNIITMTLNFKNDIHFYTINDYITKYMVPYIYMHMCIYMFTYKSIWTNDNYILNMGLLRVIE